MDGGCPQLLDLIPREREWLVEREIHENRKDSSEENKLELRLGLPGEHWSSHHKHTSNINREREEFLLSLGHSSPGGKNFSPYEKGPVWFSQQQPQRQQGGPSFLQSSSQGLSVTGKESSQSCYTIQQQQQNSTADKKAFSLPPSAAPAPNTAVPSTSQKRTAPGPVVGWPPIRSCRKNLASSSSSKPAPSETQNGNPNKKVAGESSAETRQKGLFVKINMDGVPIGRKVDLKAYDSYEKLSTAVDELFRGLLAAQRDSSASGIVNKQEEEGTAITGVLDGSGEYTLVYEDNEGDRMLVGDVPWHMFTSTVKRLRVLKSSELSALTRDWKQQGRRVLH